MPLQTPFFKGLNALLFGRRPVSALARIARMRSRADSLCIEGLESLFGAAIPARLLTKRPGARDRVYTTTTTFWTFLSQVTDPESCCIKAVARLAALRATSGLKAPACGTGPYCEARAKLPVRMLLDICAHLVSRLCATSRGPREVVFDGTGIGLQDTPYLQKKYPQHSGQKPGCGFPHLKLVGLFDLASGAWIATAKCHSRRHEARLFRNLYRHLQPGDTVVTDRGFCSYFTFVELSAKGVELVMRNHQMRKTDFRRGRRLGHRDHLIEWKKPAKPGWMKQSEYDAAPDSLVLRETGTTAGGKGFRTEEVILVTTYLGTDEKNSGELADIYLRRWKVELFFDDIKTTMGMDILRTKSPAMVCRELLMHMIAYNLLRLAIQRSGGTAGRTSFKGTVDRVQVWAPHIVGETNPRKRTLAAKAMLDAIREGKMTRPREEMVESQHRARHRKTA